MRNSQSLLIVACASLLAATISCDKDVYDPEEYKKIVEFLSPVDSVDQSHTWKLDTVYQLRVSADVNIGAKNLLILSHDPTSHSSEIMAKTYISDGETVDLSYSVPYLSETLCAALVDANGKYTLMPFKAGERELRFSEAGREPITVYTKLGLQTFTYCFDESFPVPDDYDYNDLVLRISHERTGESQISLHVELAAVGAEKQLAAAIRFVGYKAQDIESITTKDGKSFNNDIPSLSVDMIESSDVPVSGRNGEAVLNLFEDAHWAMDSREDVEYGIFKRKKFNVSTGSGSDYQQMAPLSVTYIVNFKNASKLNHFTFETLDPFILEDYNGSIWEVHTCKNIMAQTLYEYPASEIKNLPWAFEIPKADFRYPLEGVNMGFKKRSTTFGAYMTADHSFGDWSENHTKATDWYLYPTINQVY